MLLSVVKARSVSSNIQRVAVRSLASRGLNTSTGRAAVEGQQQHQHHDGAGYSHRHPMAVALGMAAATMMIGSASMTGTEPRQIVNKPKALQETTATIQPADAINQPPPRPDLPIFTREEVAEHTERESLWYTFRGGVYDLTHFYNGHPGGAPVS